MKPPYPCLWFNGNALEAAKYYVKVFKSGSKIVNIARYPMDHYSRKKGDVLMIELVLRGQRFYMLNAGDEFKFTEAVSFLVTCKDQKEIDYFWEALSKGGQKIECGWVKDKYGLPWQITPDFMSKLKGKKALAYMQAMMKMKKLDIKKLQAAVK